MAFYDSIRLEKGMYATPGKSFTQVLEELDSSKNYEGTELAGLDAYQRQLKRFDIKVGGNDSDIVEKFFQTSDSAGWSAPIYCPVWLRRQRKLTPWITGRLPRNRAKMKKS